MIFCCVTSSRLFGAKCARCNVGFGVADLVMRARGLVYHVTCFRCVVCDRQLVPGDEFALSDDGLLCRVDHDSLVLDHHQLHLSQQLPSLKSSSSSVLSPPDSVNSGDDVISYNNNNNNDSGVGMRKFQFVQNSIVIVLSAVCQLCVYQSSLTRLHALWLYKAKYVLKGY